MNRLVILVLGLVLAAPFSSAQQTLSTGVPATKSLLTDLVNKQADSLTPKGVSQLQSMMDDMIEDIYKDYPIEAIMQDMIPVYQKHLTESDVNDLIAFYSSPVGQKILRELPTIISETMQVSSARLQPVMEEAANRLKQKMEQMIEEGQKQKGNQKH